MLQRCNARLEPRWPGGRTACQLLGKIRLRRMEARGQGWRNVGPPGWRAVPCSMPYCRGSGPSQGTSPPRLNGQWSTLSQPSRAIVKWQLGRGTPFIQFERARESIARLVVNTCNRPKVNGIAKRTLGMCQATRSFVSNAEHEFPRIRSAGLFPMIPFRRSGDPQLLLMQPTLLSKRGMGDTQKRKAFS